jgi:hypothetical protein
MLSSAISAHHLSNRHHSSISLNESKKYWDLGDANFDTVEKHASIFSDLVKGIKRAPEESYEEAQAKRDEAIAQSHLRMIKGRYSVVDDDTGDKFLEYPEGRGFPPGYERNLENWARS